MTDVCIEGSQKNYTFRDYALSVQRETNHLDRRKKYKYKSDENEMNIWIED